MLKPGIRSIFPLLFLSLVRVSSGAGVVEQKFMELVTLSRQAVLTNQPFVPAPDAPKRTYIVDEPYVDYHAYNAIDLVQPWINNFLDGSDWWVQQRPRGCIDIDRTVLNRFSGGEWQALPFNVNLFNWANANAGLTAANIPVAAQYHVGVKVGHRVGSSSYPEIANVGGSGYLRLTGLPPMQYGASNRILGNGMFDSGENFPKTRQIYAGITNSQTLEFALYSESEEVVGVTWLRFIFNTTLGSEKYTVDVKSRFFARKNLPARDRGLSPICFSTMYWKPEAHDTDTVLKIAAGQFLSQKKIANPETLTVTSLGAVTTETEIRVEQQERNPDTYTYHPEAPYDQRSSFRISNIADASSPLELVVIEAPTGYEGDDNVVVAVRMTNAVMEDGPINISYTLEPYYTLPPPSSSAKNWTKY